MNPLHKFWEFVQAKATHALAERLNRDIHSYHLRVQTDMVKLKETLRAGDVILVEGNKLISRVVMAVTHSTWSHSALYVGEGRVIDPLPSTGTMLNTIDAFESLNIRVCRPMGLRETELQRVCSFAMSHLGRRYDHINVSNVLRSYFGKKRDASEFLGDISASNEVCSGLIAEAFDQVGFVVLDGVNFSQIVPGDFDLSPYFEIVKISQARPARPEKARVWGKTDDTITLRFGP
jgi:hypothetical protein